MAIFTVGPNSTFPSIAAAMAAAGPGDTIQLEAGYSNETGVVTHSGMIITGEASSMGVVLQLGSGIATVTLAGAAPFNLVDASDGNGIVGNDGDNLITVTAGADSVSGGPGDDRLFVDYRLATGAVTGDSTSNVAEAGGGGRLVTINGGFEHFTIWTGAGADTITTGAGDDDIRTGDGAGTITAGEGVNHVVGGGGADTITAGSDGNFVDGGDGANTITTGGGIDEILTGRDMDTIVAGAGNDRVTVLGGADTVDAGADSDLLIVDYSAAVTAVTGGVTGGNLATGYTGHLADLAAATLDFVEAERFWITTGTGNDTITTGDGDDMIATGAGNDYLDAGAGTDVMRGGAGNDTFFVDGADTVIEVASEGSDEVYASTSFALDAGAEIEILAASNPGSTAALNLVGNEFGQTIFGNAGANVLTGGGGADALYGRAGDDIYSADVEDVVVENAGEGFDQVYSLSSFTLNAGAAVEVVAAGAPASTSALNLYGNEYGQQIFGNAGANILSGGGGADGLYGRGGDDIYEADVQDVVIENDGEGFDQVYSANSFTLNAGAEVEVIAAGESASTAALNLYGNEYGQQIIGNAGSNILVGGGGADGLYGRAGDDIYSADGDDVVVENVGEGFDQVYSAGSFTLGAGTEIEVVATGDSASTSALDLTGNEYGQQIFGNAGANILDGGAGADWLYGLGGADTFAFTAALGGGNVDAVVGFGADDDTIALDGAVFTGLDAGALEANAFVIGAAAADADDRIVYDQATGQLLFDADGDGAGAAVQFAVLDGMPIITASDFTVI